ncbi:hypothetical protein FGIG_03822 [Fasciola gigantica]|uniref:Uncharacterized protein n=1 Tax=Fasciola gigantica TaxID=46835 RepID=A0A504YBI4_FASGI|nr:hypothetical protein FGIG_03822 [Fasciola gigantica]
MSIYRAYAEDKSVKKVTCLQWDETDDFNNRPTGKICAQDQSGKRNLYYDGIYCENNRISLRIDADHLVLNSVE